MTDQAGSFGFPARAIDAVVLERAPELGDKPALIDGPTGRAVGYAELDRRVRALAAGLAARGFGTGDTLALYMPNLPEYAMVFHGVARAGGRTTTANPLYTERELEHQLRDSGARILVTVPPFLEVAREAARAAGIDELFVLSEAEGEARRRSPAVVEAAVSGEAQDVEGAAPIADLLGDPEAAPAVEVDPATDLAVLPYSSGTTGLPKGVMLTHSNLVANMTQIRECFPIAERDVLIGVLPFFHIYGQTVIMNLGLWTGATVVTMPRFDLDQFLDLIEEHRVTHAFVVPPIALALAKHPAVGERDLSSLRTIMSGAAPLGAELAEQVAQRVGCSVIQGYGLTETSPVTHVMRAGEENRPGSIGRALPATDCRLVEPQSGADVAAGERGELWVRGPQVMAGYLNNDEATAETIDADGWLHTGDVATRDEDGYYWIVDRLKELIKYKGFQVPPAELEALIITHPQVADVAVIGVPDEECGELPKAFVVPAGEEFDPEALKAFVAAEVSPQKQIRLIERVEEIPKSPSGKILRRVLKEREAVG